MKNKDRIKLLEEEIEVLKDRVSRLEKGSSSKEPHIPDFGEPWIQGTPHEPERIKIIR